MSRKRKKSPPKASHKAIPMYPQARVVALAMYDYHIVEGNGKHSLVGIFDTLGAKQFPTQFRFYLFIKFAGNPGQHSAKIELRDKTNGKAILSLPDIEFNIPTQPVAYHDLVTQINLDIAGPGVYEWRVVLDNRSPGGLYAFQVVAAN